MLNALELDTLSGFYGRQVMSEYRYIDDDRSRAQAALDRILVSQQQIYQDLLQTVPMLIPFLKGLSVSLLRNMCLADVFPVTKSTFYLGLRTHFFSLMTCCKNYHF